MSPGNPIKAIVAMCSKNAAVPPTLKKATVAMCYKTAAVAMTLKNAAVAIN